MSEVGSPEREPRVVLREMRPLLAWYATDRLYREQPGLWELGEHGRARTLEDFGHHLAALADLSADRFRQHVAYCLELFEGRSFPVQWLTDAWRTLDDVLEAHLPPPVGDLARATMHAGLQAQERGATR